MKKRIILADEDRDYILQLQLHFIEAFPDTVTVEVITDREYFAAFFEQPQRADLLIVSQVLYDPLLQRQDIRCGLIMTERPEERTENGRFTSVYKYTDIGEIFSAFPGGGEGSDLSPEKRQARGKRILITSASGGTGKTSVAISLARMLSEYHRKVLYINVDYLQHFQSYLTDPVSVIDRSTCMRLSDGKEDSAAILRPLICADSGFDYIPPFPGPLLMNGISHTMLVRMACEAECFGDYQYIITDSDTVFNTDKMRLIEASDIVLLITRQDEEAVEALNTMLSGMDPSGSEKCFFICNMFHPARPNAAASGHVNRFRIHEYVDYREDFAGHMKEQFQADPQIQKIASLVI